jgi:hypothetical protein
VFHALGDRSMEGRALLAQVDVLQDLRRYAEARQLDEAALALFRARGERASELSAMSSLATNTMLADPARARAIYSEVLAKARPDEDQRIITLATVNRALLDEMSGEVTAAREGYAATMRLTRDGDAQKGVALINLCSLLRRAGDASAALAACDEARAILDASGNRVSMIYLDISKAPTLLERGQPEAAVATAQHAVSEARALGMAALEVFAQAALAEVLVGERRVHRAGDAIAAGRARVAAADDPEAAVLLALAASRVQAASARQPAAREAAARAAGDVAAQARAAGFILEERAARLLECELEREGAHHARASARLAVLAREARAAGDLFIARRASAERKSAGNDLPRSVPSVNARNAGKQESDHGQDQD